MTFQTEDIVTDTPPPCSQFLEFPKMARLSRECIITEKIDGTNAQILITEDGQMLVGSRTRWITPEQDNYGFARWAWDHREELLTLGTGRHFGEWWGQGIQRKYNMPEKRWSLFNVSRWCMHGETPQQIPTADPRIVKMQDVLPPCCHLVPVLYRGLFTTEACENALSWLRENGSAASPGFRKPEGIVCFHVAGNVGFKKTLEKDEMPKTLVSSANASGDGEHSAMNTSPTNFEPLPARAARSSAQWVKAYGTENLGVDRATGHCRNCRHRFHAEDSYFPDEGDYCAAVSVDEIQFCPAWREHCQNDQAERLPPKSYEYT